MFKYAALAMISLGALSFTGCNAPVPSTSTTPTMGASQADQATVVKDTGLNGNKAVALEILPPSEGGYHTQAIVHKWVDNDIFEYVATLKVWNGTAYVDFATPLTVTIPRKGLEPKTKAVFTSLKQGSKYQVALVAKGDIGGTAATTTLNGNTATSQVFDFTATQDVEDTLSATMQVVFDAVAFSGSGSATVTAPADGTYANPASPEAGTAQ